MRLVFFVNFLFLILFPFFGISQGWKEHKTSWTKENIHNKTSDILYVWSFSGLNFRQKPYNNAKILEVIPHGEKITLLNKGTKHHQIFLDFTEFKSKNNNLSLSSYKIRDVYCSVKYKKQDGFAYLGLLKKTPPPDIKSMLFFSRKLTKNDKYIWEPKKNSYENINKNKLAFKKEFKHGQGKVGQAVSIKRKYLNGVTIEESYDGGHQITKTITIPIEQDQDFYIIVYNFLKKITDANYRYSGAGETGYGYGLYGDRVVLGFFSLEVDRAQISRSNWDNITITKQDKLIVVEFVAGC